MDILATQILDDTDIAPTQNISNDIKQDVQIGTLHIGRNKYPIKSGINKIGRHPDCNIMLIDQTVSKCHAEIEASYQETSAWICDLHSSNKTKLNNSLLRPGRCYELKNGSVLEFGSVRATYRICDTMNDSMIPETPASQSRLRKQKTFIPGTPDSPVNHSGTSIGDISMIPGTQANDSGAFVFRQPSIPQRSSTDRLKKILVEDSSIDDSINSSRNSRGNENVGEQGVSIHDMETQSETDDDIHDIVTQKICLSSMKALKELNRTSSGQIDIHDLETQRDLDGDVTDIHDMDTQHDVDIHDMKTPRRIQKQNISDDSDKISLDETQEIEAKESDNVMGDKNERVEIDQSKKSEDSTRQTECLENSQQAPEKYLRLELVTNFEDDCSELDESRNLLDSPNLLEDFVENDELSEVSKSKASPLIGTSRLQKSDEASDKSTDEENIFDAATQTKNDEDENIFEAATQRVSYKSKGSFAEDESDASDQEDALLRYSRVEEQEKEKQSQSQLFASDDSDTDEEGHFIDVALKEKETSTSSKSILNEIDGSKNDPGTSRESDDIFETPTQNVNTENNESSTKKIESSKDDVDFDMPTQVIETKMPGSYSRHGETREIETIDMEMTQIVRVAEISVKANDPPKCAKNKTETNDELMDITEMEDDVATQILSCPENNVATSTNKLNADIIDECSVEDLDYEMAPTQLIDTMEHRKSTPANNKSASKKSKASKKVNLDDTLERNLNAMFDDVNEENMDEQSQISTQVLRNVLQASQSENKTSTESVTLNTDSESVTNSSAKKSKRGRKSNAANTDSVKDSVKAANSRMSTLKDVNTNNDSQNTDNYFSVITSRRKRNVFVDSQDISESHDNTTSDNKSKQVTVKSKNITVGVMDHSTIDTPSKCAPKGSSTPMSTRKANTMNERMPKNDESANINISAIRKPEEADNRASGPLVDVKQSLLLSKELDNDDEDILSNFPEVRISGTLSNPGSPTSSTEYKKLYNIDRSKWSQEKTAPKTTRGSRKSFKTNQTQENTEFVEPCRVGRKRKSSSILRRLPEVTSTNPDAEKTATTAQESSDKRSYNNSKQSKEKKSNVTKEDVPLQPKVILTKDLTDYTKQNPFIQSNGRTRGSSKENLDRSSVFQVEKEVPIVNTAEESAKKKDSRVPRLRKRSFSASDVVENRYVKKPKEGSIEDSASEMAKRRHSQNGTSTTGRRSANTLAYVTNRKSPVNVNDSDNLKSPTDSDSIELKEVMIKVVKVSANTPTMSLTESTISNKSNQSSPNSSGRRDSNRSVQISKSIDEKAVQGKPKKRQKTSRKPVRNSQLKSRDLTDQVGQESQEVEMIMMKSLLQDQNVHVETKNLKTINESRRSTRTRNTRKRANSNTRSDIDTEISASSELSESETTQFQVPTSRAKRAKISKESSKVTDVSMDQSITVPKKKGKPPSRSTRSQQISIDSFFQGNVENSVNEKSENTSLNKTNKSKAKGKQSKAQQLESEKKRNSNVTEENITSDMDSSIDNASVFSPPSRSRRSMSSSFSLASPLRVKHKVSFTGVQSNNYNTLLKKLGASQVDDPSKCTVLVTDKVRRTVKFLCAIAQSVPIVSVDWLNESETAGHFVDLEAHILKDPAAEMKFGFKLGNSLERAKQHKLLQDFTIVVTPNVSAPPVSELKSIVASCGGKCLVRAPPSWPEKSLIISSKDDLANAKKFATKAPKTVTIQSTEFLLTGILRQELDFIKYKLI